MDFTREPIIETVITPKEGYKLVVRSSKSAGQEEYFVDSVEVVSFGYSFFLRSLERPKAFLVPVNDYEVLEVRETRMVLKNVGIDRTIKIGGGREAARSAPKETLPEREEQTQEVIEVEAPSTNITPVAASTTEPRPEKKRERRRHYKRRRGREEGSTEEGGTDEEGAKKEEGVGEEISTPSPMPFMSSVLPPPSTLISETIARYKDNALFKGAFFVKEDKEEKESEEQKKEEILSHSEDILESVEMNEVSLEPSSFGTLEPLENEEMFQEEASRIFSEDNESLPSFLGENFAENGEESIEEVIEVDAENEENEELKTNTATPQADLPSESKTD